MRNLPKYKHTKTAVHITIAKVIQKYKGNWCLATQATILSLLFNNHGIKIGLRALNYHLADLRKHFLIHSIKRSHRNADGTLCLLSTANALTSRGCYALAKLGFRWAWAHGKKLRKRYEAVVPDTNVKAAKEKVSNLVGVSLGYNPFKDPDFRKAVGVDKIIFDSS